MAKKKAKKYDPELETEFYIVSREKLEDGEVMDSPDIEFLLMTKDISEARDKAEECCYEEEETIYIHLVSVPEYQLVSSFHSALLGDPPTYTMTVLEEFGVYEPQEDSDDEDDEEADE